MAQWTPQLEELVRAVGRHGEEQMKCLTDPAVSPLMTFAKMAFKSVAGGAALIHSACREAGFEFKGPGYSGLQPLVVLAEDNGSTAADALKQVIATEQSMREAFRSCAEVTNKPTFSDIVRRIKLAKQHTFTA